MTETILVTGGCGFVGSNLVRNLVAGGNNIRVLDNLSRGQFEYIEDLTSVKFFNADMTDISSCREAFKDVDKVVHLAALGSVVESVEDPQSNFEMNVQGTFNVLNLCVEAKVKKMIFSSTGGALIGNANPPVNEQSLPKPISPYGASKLCCEAYCHAFSQSYDINTICLRFANVYGPNSQHKVGVINKFVQCIIEGQPLTIFGDGGSTRDYIHVSDLCNGIKLALENPKIKNDVIHIATGRETSLQKLAQIFLDASGLSSNMLKYKPSRIGEVERNFALYDYANEILGYEPKIDLEQGIGETIEYLKAAYQG